MVVVEGVARSLDPHINIWQVARPVVESYIKENIGPGAMLRDLVKTARVIGRFGPKLPQIAESALARQTEAPSKPPKLPWYGAAAWMGLGAGLLLAGVWLGTLL